MTTSLKFWHVTTMVGAVCATTLASRHAYATNWVMGATQQAASGYFTEVSASFTVPAKPASNNAALPTSMWPGLENSDGDLVQPVLAWAHDHDARWTMHTEVFPGQKNVQGIDDVRIAVNPGDTIWAFAYLDQNNKGANCSLSTGNNCNYLSSFLDLTTGASYTQSKDWLMRTGPTTAIGVVFEAQNGTYDSCGDFPSGGIAYYSYVYQNGSSGLYTPVAGNFKAHWPGNDSPWRNGTFTTPTLNSGGVAFPNCMNIGMASGSEAILFLNAY